MGQKQREQIAENMSVRNEQAQFLQQRFEVLFRRLLAMEAKLVMKRIAFPTELDGEPIIGFGLSHPLGGRSFHRGLSPWP
jgi:hypothetical protein